MNKLIILGTLFLVSCANTQYRKHDLFTVKYTVREYYLPINTVNPSPTIQKTRKPLKKAKKTVKIDCKRVFQEINKCSI